MAVKGYTNQAEVENYGLITVDPTFESQLDSWIEVVENFIDEYTGRNFLADDIYSEHDKLYDGDGTNQLLIDDAVDVQEIKIYDADGTLQDTLEAGEFYAYPANSLPITKIRVRDFLFLPGDQNVAVTARWGYSNSVPAAIRMVATVLLTGIINYGKGSGKGGVRSETIGSYSVTYADEKGWQSYDQAMRTLDMYKKFNF